MSKEKLILTYRELGKQIRESKINLPKIIVEQNVIVQETEVRQKVEPFNNNKYLAFIVNINGSEYYADFLY